MSLVLASGCYSHPAPSQAQEAVESSQENLIGGGYFGVLTTEKYQDTWCPAHCVDPWWYPEQCYAWEMTNGFANVYDDHNTKLFYGDLGPDTGAMLQEGYDTISPRGADLVDVLYLHTHGAVYDTNNSVWAMWTNNSWVPSQAMRLGDDGRGAKLFVSYACYTMDTDDGNQWNRLGPLFSGGLKLMVGGYHTLSWGYDMWYTTHDFAGYLQDPTTVEWAWIHSNWYAAMSQNPAIMATGVNGDDCWSRLYNKNIDHVIHNYDSTMPTLRDYQIGSYCWEWFTDLGG